MALGCAYRQGPSRSRPPVRLHRPLPYHTIPACATRTVRDPPYHTPLAEGKHLSTHFVQFSSDPGYDQLQANYPALTSWPKVNPSLDPLRSVQFHWVNNARVIATPAAEFTEQIGAELN